MLFALVLSVAAAFAQPAPVFRAAVSLVHVDAEVTASDGRTLTGFSKDDFLVFD